MPKHIIDSGDQSITGNLTTTGSVSANSATIPTLNGNIVASNDLQVVGQLTVPNQTFGPNTNVITKQLVEDMIASYIVSSGRKWVRLGGSTGATQGANGSTSSTVTGYASAGAGNVINAKAAVQYDAGMSWQGGSGSPWSFPSKFMFGGVASGLLQHYTFSVTGVTLGSNQFNYGAAGSTLINSRVWSSAFPDGTYVTNVSGTTITVSNNATTTVSGSHTLTVCYEGVTRLCFCHAPTTSLYGYGAFYATDRLILSQNTSSGASQLKVNSPITATASGIAGNTFITLTATNSLVVADQLISGNGIPTDTRVASVSGTTVNLKNAAGNAVALPSNIGPITVGFLPISINNYYLAGEGIVDNTTFTIESDTTNGGFFYLNLNTPITQNIVANAELFYITSQNESFRNNNVIGFEYLPDPTSGILKFRLFAMRAGIVYRSAYATSETGPIDLWQQYWTYIIDYDDSTRDLRLFITEQTSQNGVPEKPTTPILTLNIPSSMSGRNSGTTGSGAVVQACANSRLAPPSSTALRLNIHRLDYFNGNKYIP